MVSHRALIAALLLVVLGACTSTDDAETAVVAEAAGVRVVTPVEGAALADDPPPGLVVLDVRTQEEYTEGHLDGAIMIDFYADDFADRIAALDPEVPYLLYCRSGNRSSQARSLMQQLGFDDVADIDGGIVAWADAGLPVTSG